MNELSNENKIKVIGITEKSKKNLSFRKACRELSRFGFPKCHAIVIVYSILLI